MATVLVTGANGFVGRALCRRLFSEGYHVKGTIRNAEAAGNLPDGVVALPLTISPVTPWVRFLDGVDTVVHLAARVHVMHDMVSDPLALYRNLNVASTERLARIAAAAGVRRFIFVSSVKVMGEESVVPYSEEVSPSPRDPYGVSKWEAEQELAKVAKETGLEVVIIRPPLIYGPGVKANFLRLMKIIDRGIPLPFASIDNCRSLIYLENLVDLIATSIMHTKAAGQTYLVSDCEDVSTPELVRRLANAFRKPAMLIPLPPKLMRIAGRITGKQDAVDRLLSSLLVDCGKICRELNWRPPFTMQEGITATTQWYTGNKVNAHYREKL